jgi:hypothetical protein
MSQVQILSPRPLILLYIFPPSGPGQLPQEDHVKST